MNRILIIDDHLEYSACISEQITALYPQVRVTETHNGREGISLALDDPPDVILLDTHMPIMDGYEVARALRALPKTRAIPLIAMTLSGNEHSKILADLRPLCEGVLFKPFQTTQLANIMQRVGIHNLDLG